MKGKRTREDNGQGSTRKLENGKWECVVQSNFINPKTLKPKRFKRTGATEQEARKNAKLAQLHWEKEYEYGIDVKVDKTKTFGNYMREFIDEQVSQGITQSTYRSYTSHMENIFYKYPIANLQLHMLSQKTFQDYYDTIGSKYSKKTSSLPIQLCRRCCIYLVDKSLISENYAAQAHLQKEIKDEYFLEREKDEKERKKIFTKEDILKFYDAFKNNYTEYAVVAVFILETGLRSGEFAAMMNSNINIENRTMLVDKARATRYRDNIRDNGLEEYLKVTKNTESRTVYLTDLAIECIEYMQTQTKLYCSNNKLDLLYPTFRNGRMRTNATMEVGFKGLCDKLGIDRDVHRNANGIKKGLCIHSLRHTMISYANTAKDGNPAITSLMVGHNVVRTENIYTHSNEEILSSIQTPSKLFIDKEENEDFDEEEIKLMKKLMKKYKDYL